MLFNILLDKVPNLPTRRGVLLFTQSDEFFLFILIYLYQKVIVFLHNIKLLLLKMYI
jgi:hypothetical protein